MVDTTLAQSNERPQTAVAGVESALRTPTCYISPHDSSQPQNLKESSHANGTSNASPVDSSPESASLTISFRKKEIVGPKCAPQPRITSCLSRASELNRHNQQNTTLFPPDNISEAPATHITNLGDAGGSSAGSSKISVALFGPSHDNVPIGSKTSFDHMPAEHSTKANTNNNPNAQWKAHKSKSVQDLPVAQTAMWRKLKRTSTNGSIGTGKSFCAPARVDFKGLLSPTQEEPQTAKTASDVDSTNSVENSASGTITPEKASRNSPPVQLQTPRAPLYVPAVLRTGSFTPSLPPYRELGTASPDSLPSDPLAAPPSITRAANQTRSDTGDVGPGLRLNLNLPVASPFVSLADENSTSLRLLRRPKVKPTSVPTDHWVPDKLRSNCTNKQCNRLFTFWERRHHCRRCGEIFCRMCVSHVLELNVYDADFNFRVEDVVGVSLLSPSADNLEWRGPDKKRFVSTTVSLGNIDEGVLCKVCDNCAADFEKLIYDVNWALRHGLPLPKTQSNGRFVTGRNGGHHNIRGTGRIANGDGRSGSGSSSSTIGGTNSTDPSSNGDETPRVVFKSVYGGDERTEREYVHGTERSSGSIGSIASADGSNGRGNFYRLFDGKSRTASSMAGIGVGNDLDARARALSVVGKDLHELLANTRDPRGRGESIIGTTTVRSSDEKVPTVVPADWSWSSF